MSGLAEGVREALLVVHDPGNSGCRKADEWLQALIKSDSGWSLFDMIVPDGEEVVVFFAANAIKTKARKDLHTLSPPVQADFLRRLLSLLPYLKQLPASVSTQICLTIAIIAPIHTDSIPVIAGLLGSDSTCYTLDTLTYMAEEADLLRCDIKMERTRNKVTEATVKQGFVTPVDEEDAGGDSHEYIASVRACSEFVINNLVKFSETHLIPENRNKVLKCYAAWVPFTTANSVTILLNAASEGIVRPEFSASSCDVICALAESCGMQQTTLAQTLLSTVVHQQSVEHAVQATEVGHQVARAICAVAEANVLQLLATISSPNSQTVFNLLAQLVGSDERSLSLAAIQVWGTVGVSIDRSLKSVPDLDMHISHLIRVACKACEYPVEADAQGYWGSSDEQTLDVLRIQHYHDTVKNASRTNLPAALESAWGLVQGAMGRSWREQEAALFMLSAIPVTVTCLGQASTVMASMGSRGSAVIGLMGVVKPHFKLVKAISSILTTSGFCTWLRQSGTTDEIGQALRFVMSGLHEMQGNPKLQREATSDFRRLCMVGSRKLGTNFPKETVTMLEHITARNDLPLESCVHISYAVAEVVHGIPSETKEYIEYTYKLVITAARQYAEQGLTLKATCCVAAVAQQLKNASLQAVHHCGVASHPVVAAWCGIQSHLWGELKHLAVKTNFNDAFMAEVYNALRSMLSVTGNHTRESIPEIMATLGEWSSVKKHPNVMGVLTDVMLLFACDKEVVPKLVEVTSTYFEAYGTALRGQTPPFSQLDMVFPFLNLMKYTILVNNVKNGLVQRSLLRPEILKTSLVQNYVKICEEIVHSDLRAMNSIRCLINIIEYLVESPADVFSAIHPSLVSILLKLAIFKPIDMLSLAGSTFTKLQTKIGPNAFPELVSSILTSIGVEETAQKLFLNNMEGNQVLIRLHSHTKPFRVKRL
eukprot:TRINITY_DN17614_c0_g1_i1.p1 TRINITY_DN17614_c0_g1~~TRINITY_DN17614_c0_g1_i1.p1  ORF type:complete len:954 (+),score=182.59 TRINITY_DN17614_c0_g1_i1:57-2864(+)